MTKLFHLEQRHLLASACDSYYETDFPVSLSPASPACTFEPALNFTAGDNFSISEVQVTGFSVSGNSDKSWNVSGNIELKVIPNIAAPSTTGTCVFPINGTVASVETLKSITATGTPEGRGDTGSGLPFGSILNKVDFANGIATTLLPINAKVDASGPLTGLTYISPEFTVDLKVCTDATESKISIAGSSAVVDFSPVYTAQDLGLSVGLPVTNNPNASLKMASDAGFTAYVEAVVAQMNREVSKSR